MKQPDKASKEFSSYVFKINQLSTLELIHQNTEIKCKNNDLKIYTNLVSK